MPDQCENCSAPLDGDFCAQCGQPDRTIDVPIGAFAKELVTETLELDSRLRMTMEPLFLRPGSVPKDYVAGHRARFVPPVRLYLFASFFMFLTVQLGPGALDLSVKDGDGTVLLGTNPSAVDRETAEDDAPPTPVEAPSVTPDASTSGAATESLGERISAGMARVAQDRQGFTGEFTNRLAQSMFFLLPAFALMLKILYRRRLYVHHLVFAIYFHSFAFLLAAVLSVPSVLRLETLSAIMDLGMLAVPVYLYLGMRRFYEESRIKTLLKFGALFQAYLGLGVITVIGLLVLSVLTF